MADATIEAIEAAVFARLQTLSRAANPANPFVLVDRWAGEITKEGGVDEQTLGKSPSALLAFDSALPEGEDGAEVETIGRDLQVVEKHVFRVYVTVRDERSVAKATQGATGQPGVLRCARLVKEALAGVAVADLFAGDVVRLVDHRPWSVQRGHHYTHLLRFSARASLPPTDDPTPGVPFAGLVAHVTDSEPDEEGDRQPLAEVQVEFEI